MNDQHLPQRFDRTAALATATSERLRVALLLPYFIIIPFTTRTLERDCYATEIASANEAKPTATCLLQA